MSELDKDNRAKVTALHARHAADWKKNPELAARFTTRGKPPGEVAKTDKVRLEELEKKYAAEKT